MTYIAALLLGIVEGATEFLPVSSTGHLILVSKLLAVPDSPLLHTFEIVIQCGAILAVVALYWRRFFNLELIKKLIVAFLPTGIIGFTVYPYVKGYLLNNSSVVVASLFIGGIVLIVFELFYHERKDAVWRPEDITYSQALVIGLFQSIAVIPGISRSAATIVGGLSSGVRRLAIVEFSFMLAVPTMAAATGLDLLKSYKEIPSSGIPILLFGTVIAFIVAVFALQFLIQFIRRFTFIPFGLYRIVIALLFFLLILNK